MADRSRDRSGPRGADRSATPGRAGRPEFAFELELCATIEAQRRAVVARQLGAGVGRPAGRVLDVVVVEPGPTFEERAGLTARRIPADAIESDVGPGRFRPVTEAIDAPPERARAVAERAAEIGFFELDRCDGSLCARQVTRYPADWFGPIVGVENKPDLGSPGGLSDQLRTDVGLGLVDRIVLATESHVTGAHLNRIPEPVGVWRVRDDPAVEATTRGDGGDHDLPGDGSAAGTGDGRIEVVREPEPLPVADWGTELLERRPGGVDVAFASPAEKARARRRIAERAYGKGWRPTELPGCAKLEPEAHPTAPTASTCLPHCTWAGRVVDAASECGADCPGFEPAKPPATDPEAERAARTPWRADPSGRQRRQAGLDRFGSEQ